MCSNASISSGRDLRRFFKPFLACAGTSARSGPSVRPAWPAESGEPTEAASPAAPLSIHPASPRDRAPE